LDIEIWDFIGIWCLEFEISEYLFYNPRRQIMEVKTFTADELFNWLTAKEDFLLLDVRNEVEFGRFKVEGPYPIDMINVPYVEFIEHEQESVDRVPRGRKVRILCAKEGSAQYVGEILVNHGFTDVASMLSGIKAWGNLLAPIRLNDGEGYELYQFRRPGKASCSYGLVYGREMMLFDPSKSVGVYQRFAEQRGCVLVRTFETHRQADYISGSPMLVKATGAGMTAPEPDFKEARFHYTPAVDGEVYTFAGGGPEVKVMHTPGHTPGSTSYLVDGQFLISGDTVFILSIGRPDLGGKVEEWSKLLFKTMTQKIRPLDDRIIALPGHYMDWKEADDGLAFRASMGKIKVDNSDIYGIEDEKEFFQFINENMRSQPEEYAKIREINAGLREVDEEEQDILDLGKNECAASAQPPR
jgi:glyoxylase-like metal-dependent hydrolase (beta-lactamase superfamily II)/rhodanese-related sulfurtransferase